MECRYLENRDYLTLHKWWVDNKFSPPSIDDLPMINGELQGLIVHMEGVEICAGFLIDTTVKNGAMIEYCVANFDVKDKELRKEALNFLLQKLSEAGKKIGKKYLFTSVKNKGLIERLKDSGFVIGSSGTLEMIKKLY